MSDWVCIWKHFFSADHQHITPSTVGELTVSVSFRVCGKQIMEEKRWILMKTKVQSLQLRWFSYILKWASCKTVFKKRNLVGKLTTRWDFKPRLFLSCSPPPCPALFHEQVFTSVYQGQLLDQVWLNSARPLAKWQSSEEMKSSWWCWIFKSQSLLQSAQWQRQFGF